MTLCGIPVVAGPAVANVSLLLVIPSVLGIFTASGVPAYLSYQSLASLEYSKINVLEYWTEIFPAIRLSENQKSDR